MFARSERKKVQIRHLNIINISASLWISLSFKCHIDQLLRELKVKLCFCFRSCSWVSFPTRKLQTNKTPQQDGVPILQHFRIKIPHAELGGGNQSRRSTTRWKRSEAKSQKVGGGAAGVASPFVRSVFSRMNQRDTSFSPPSLPPSPHPSSLCAARNEAEPRGSRFDCCLSWLSLSAPTEGTVLGPTRISSPPPPTVTFASYFHSTLVVSSVLLRFFPSVFNCRFRHRHGHVLQLCILRAAAAAAAAAGQLSGRKLTRQTGTSMKVAEK